MYTFQGGADGVGPENGVIYQNGLIYGTTQFGDGSGCNNQGCGTIFSINPSTNVKTILYAFDEAGGYHGLVYGAGMLYATASFGGEYGDGTIISVNPATGVSATVYSFAGGSDGVQPNPRLLYQNALLYGTTSYGGSGTCHLGGCGTLFAINPTTGDESVVRSFGKKDGKYPVGALAYRAGSFFGDTWSGGNPACKRGCGVSFKVKAATGHESMVNDFENWGEIYSGITIVGENAYETLSGEILEVNLKTGQQTVLHTFTGGADGGDPVAALTYNDGAFYGTTTYGGNRGCYDGDGCGTVFKFVP